MLQTNAYFSFDLDKSRRLIHMIMKLLHSQNFSKVWKSGVRQTFCAMPCAIASKMWLKEHTLAFCSSDEFHCKLWEKFTMATFLQLQVKTFLNVH